MGWSHAAKSNVNLFVKAQNSTIQENLDMSWYIRNYHINEETSVPR